MTILISGIKHIYCRVNNINWVIQKDSLFTIKLAIAIPSHKNIIPENCIKSEYDINVDLELQMIEIVNSNLCYNNSYNPKLKILKRKDIADDKGNHNHVITLLVEGMIPYSFKRKKFAFVCHLFNKDTNELIITVESSWIDIICFP